MRYRLRTLLLVLAVGLAPVAAAWSLRDGPGALEFAKMFVWAASFAALALFAVRAFLLFKRT
jgi:hypothetical protein